MIEEFKCVLCSEKRSTSFVEELDDYLCEFHLDDLFDWNANNQGAPAIDYLREKL